MPIDHRPEWIARAFGVVKKLVIVILAIAALGLFLAWMGGAFHEKVPPGVVPVERPKSAGRTLVTAERTVGMETVTAVGSVQPRRKTEVASQLLASVREIKPRPGDRVKVGEVLVVLDDRELLARQREAAAAFAAAEADLVTRRSNYQRIKALGGSVSAEELNNVEGAFRVAETQVNRAKATIGRIEVQITYTKIVANADGLVSDRFVEPGDVATPGKPLLTVYDPNDLELQVNVPESLASGITVGQKLDIRIDANKLVAAAAVREIVPLAQQASRSVLVKIALPQTTSNPVLPGMYGRAAIPVGQAERVWLPKTAVLQRGQLDLVEVAESDGTLSRRFVRVGRVSGGKVEILSGVSPGEQIALPNQ
ncbi:MAG TPA: efflux RND transporter periplasmic adaptor subunit [Fimbriiglobus sp.]|jgi:RND family efflux transporter MFP subunit